VDACVKIGNRNILLASLSAENPSAQLQAPVILEERDFLYVMPRDSNSAADIDDAVAVEGFFLWSWVASSIKFDLKTCPKQDQRENSNSG
jgi:hypothetical protein